MRGPHQSKRFSFSRDAIDFGREWASRRLPTRRSINSSSSGSLQRRLVSVVTGSCCMLSLPSPQQRPAMNANSLSSLHGLTFGGRRRMKKPAGLEDASSLMASTAAAAAAEKKGKGGAVHQQPPPPPPRCQVEGCDVDLTGMKAYYCRHKVCGAHSKAPLVVVAGIQQRFCQQCSRFHQLHEFDQGKRSCRRRLACHNERRRKLPPAPPTSHTGHMLSALQGGTRHYNKFSGFLVDFTQTKPPELSQHSWQRGPVRDDSHRYHSGSPGAPSAKMVNHGAFPFLQEFPPAGSQPLTGGSDSSCALSLLSTQPRDSSKATHRGISATAGEAPTAEHPYTASSWSCKAPQGSSSSSGTSFEARLNQVGEDDGSGSHFAGELELVLQGKRQCVGLELSGRFRDSDDGIHWSL